MASATAFFSFFALPPIVILLSQLYGGLLNEQHQQVSGQLFKQLALLFGDQSARQLQDISQHLQQRRSNSLLPVLSVLILLLASTTLFTIIKNSLNQLWHVKSAANRRFWHVLTDKLIALSLIILAGFLFIISLTLQRTITGILPTEPILYNSLGYAVHHGLSIILLAVWFAFVFKFLPDIRIHWQAVWVGALVTGGLVEIGEQVLDLLLINNSIRSLYGSAGDIILVLLFVFYSALIFYYGASFTRQYARWIHLEAEPGAHSVAYQVKEVTDSPE
ncbi:YihY/virulence factor BrkB family protein [Spirosoma taeanense]|uniref:YihY/virulence factor BrkB family protein n=1 Tax=Spirosoma taeanense TaxID=2735870 RepID=A0A6M5YA10_9BACT|nr:YihY/virulence factor BrkB family protein [Spirosoma taeanense]QJW90344.1 YihY/virulence factor BrkB family protein [Spirosoma taeanense]